MDDTVSSSDGAIRFRPIDRQQLISAQLDELLPADHTARLIAEFVAGLDFGPLHATIKSRGCQPGAPAFQPELLFSLWLLATVEGMASARQLEASCERDLA
jgi:transposase